ncbi:MAG: TetR/AcrR family transcriptional regulator [Acidimicrobiales bacterium]
MSEQRRRRANGEASRERVLDAAAQIAGERGYEGTSINLISERSGLPPSSIYWHFKDKDELMAAVIDRSFVRWQEASAARRDDDPPSTSPDDEFRVGMRRVGGAIAEFPDFLRLGLMLVLERRPQEPTARGKFLEVRAAAAATTRAGYAAQFADLTADDVDALVTLTLALADGLFVAEQAGESSMADSFELLATAVLGTVDRLRAERAERADRADAEPKRPTRR